ncbi:MAG: long-chain fatty acid--CoA ligase [Acidobacteriota bacterium]
MAIRTIPELFLVNAKNQKPDCLLHKVDGQYRPISTAEMVDSVQRLAKALADAGVQKGDCVGLMAENGPHWPIIDFATLSLGAVVVPIYPTLTPDQAAYIANDASTKIVFAEGFERYRGLQVQELPALERLVLIGDSEGEEGVETLDDWIEAGAGATAEEFEANSRAVEPEDLATFIYTSGTTGNPKGVMLTHHNIISNALSSLDYLGIEPHFTALSFLPLSHSFERTVSYIYFYCGVTIAYAESVAHVAQNMGEVRPHVFVSVPRVYEKILGKVMENIAQAPPLRQKIFHWAVGVGRKTLPYRLKNKTPPGLLGIQLLIADKLVFGKLRDRLGGRFRMACSGGAPLSREVAEFFWGAGISIFEGYGLSETSPVLTVNAPGHTKLGSVGRAIDIVTLKIAEDGEILAKGPNIMKGYHNLPDATAEAIDDDGWFHTGDIGVIDDEGYLRITDRKKEIIVNAYGKNVAPAPIENALKSSPYINQVMVIGDRRKFLSALVVPDLENLKPWAQKQGIDSSDDAALATDDRVRELIDGEIRKVNGKLAKYERVGIFHLLPEEWTIEGGELTPTLKIKRRIINDKFGDVVDQMYEEAEG